MALNGCTTVGTKTSVALTCGLFPVGALTEMLVLPVALAETLELEGLNCTTSVSFPIGRTPAGTPITAWPFASVAGNVAKLPLDKATVPCSALPPPSTDTVTENG